MSSKGYWRWQVRRKKTGYQGRYKAWWWLWWSTPYGHYFHPEQADAQLSIVSHVKQKEVYRSFRQAKWEVVEEGSWPE